MNIRLNGINGKLNMEETAQNEAQRKKNNSKIRKTSVSCGTPSSILTCVTGRPVEKRWRWRQKILEKTMAKSFPNLMK